MPGKVSFHFDDGLISHYEQAFPIFQRAGAAGCLAVPALRIDRIGKERLLEMQDAGWEILSHSVNHIKMCEPLDAEAAEKEIGESKRMLEAQGFKVRQFITPMSTCHPAHRALLRKYYDAAFTVYTNSQTVPIEKLVIERPVNAYELHRASLSAKTLDELRAYVDYVSETDSWIVFYEHGIGIGTNVTAEKLEALIGYCLEKGVRIMTSSAALDEERCRTKILRDGWDGTYCYVHARMGADGNRRLITTQLLNTEGSDVFYPLCASFSRDGGKTWSEIRPQASFDQAVTNGIRTNTCDVTPYYHKKTGKFIVTGHQASYSLTGKQPLSTPDSLRSLPYAVFDEAAETFGEQCFLSLPGEKYRDFGSGCSQIHELPDGDLLIPISFRRDTEDGKPFSDAAVIRCAFDGRKLTLKEIGKDIRVNDEVRGIGECSLAYQDGKYYLTVRGDTHGYVSVSEDGLNYTDPKIWCWEDGEIVPSYNTQSHWMQLGGKLWLVYTRKCGTNDHVFRHRAPLFVAEVNTDTVTLKRDSEYVAVPERGARLGNFGVCHVDDGHSVIIVSEWMQPKGCEAYGSCNAIWYTDVYK